MHCISLACAAPSRYYFKTSFYALVLISLLNMLGYIQRNRLQWYCTKVKNTVEQNRPGMQSAMGSQKENQFDQ